MATINVFFILLTLTLSSTIHARESQFFNKFSNNTPKESQPLNTNDQQQPEFIPQTQDSGSYGLYGHQTGQLPPSTTTTNNNNNNKLPSYLPENYNPVAYTTPIHSSTQDIPNEFKDPQTYQYNGQSKLYNSEETNEDNVYNSEKQGFDDAKFMETEDVGNKYNSEKQVENGMYNSQMQFLTRNNGNMYNPEKQGMSDTRFLENGKYFYDVNMENNNYNANMNGRGFNSRNEYDTQGYYGNDEKYSYDRYNSNGMYQKEEEQFDP
ncbi:uncharacterized protein LOC143566678 [Bidens hawaiensis]|uniref:uncharacterized protein LOC143566678 n=1 Tax=Bidens hawaiensis TaxID=980011 RepID=UPI00404933F5